MDNFVIYILLFYDASECNIFTDLKYFYLLLLFPLTNFYFIALLNDFMWVIFPKQLDDVVIN